MIGNGVVIHPPALLKEIETLSAQGIEVGGRLHVSDRAHVILPYHLAEERLTEESASHGRPPRHDPARDRAVLSRQGRPGPRRPGRRPLPPGRFREHLDRIVAYKNRLLAAMLPDFEPLDAGKVADEYLEFAERLRPFVRDTTTWLHEALGRGKRLLFEGAQGSLLDVDHGSYPYVTSSNSSAAGIAAGSGVPTRHIDRWIGVVKAYTTRVGGGPFPTEQDNAIGERIRRVGHEYGTVTGRPRRCGWFDAVAVRYSARVSGSTELAVMLLDVLSGLDELKVAVAYEHERSADAATCPPRWPTSNAAGRSTRPCPAGPRTSPACAMVGPAPEGAGTMCSSSRSRSAFRCRSSRSGRTAGRRSSVADGTKALIVVLDVDDRACPARIGLRGMHASIIQSRLWRSPKKDWRGSPRRVCGPSSSPGTSPSSWTATADGPSGAACRGSWATAAASRASARSSRKAAGSGSISSRSIASRSRTGSGRRAS